MLPSTQNCQPIAINSQISLAAMKGGELGLYLQFTKRNVQVSRFSALLTCCHGDGQTSKVGGARTSQSTLVSWKPIARSPIIFQGSYRVVG